MVAKNAKSDFAKNSSPRFPEIAKRKNLVSSASRSAATRSDDAAVRRSLTLTRATAAAHVRFRTRRTTNHPRPTPRSSSYHRDTERQSWHRGKNRHGLLNHRDLCGAPRARPRQGAAACAAYADKVESQRRELGLGKPPSALSAGLVSPGGAARGAGTRSVATAGLFGLGLPELVVIGGVAAVLFGPSKLPELGKSLGKTVKSFQAAATEFSDELKEGREAAEEAEAAEPKQIEDGEDKKTE